MAFSLLANLDLLNRVTDSEVVQFFQSKLSFIDFLVVGLGCFLLVYQFGFRMLNFSWRFSRQAKTDPLYLDRLFLKLRYIGTLIELLPLLGILGTVWGLMKALYFLQRLAAPTIGDIAVNIAPALSTTFFGLSFAVLNLFVFNYVDTYLNELIAWYNHSQTLPKEEAPDSAKASDGGKASQKGSA